MGKRRTFNPEFKAQVVLEVLTGVKSGAELCREHRLKPQLISCWKKQFLEQASTIFATKRSKNKERERVAELERMVGRLTMELELSKKASSILNSLSTGNGR